VSQLASFPQASVAIIGGGIIGMSIAWRLSQRGFRVTVFEKGEIGGEASWAGAGMLAPGGELEGPSPLAAIALESRALYDAFVRELESCSGLAIDYQENGALELAYSPEEQQGLDAKAEAQRALGIRSKPVSAADVAAFWPRVRTEGLVAARFYPDDGVVNPREVMLALAAACRKLGVSVQQNCAVPRIEVSGNSVEVHQKSYTAAVIAAGAWSSHIEVIGSPPLPPTEPIKGHLIGYQQPQQTCNTVLRHGHAYLLQRANGLLVAGATVEHVGFDRSVEPALARSIAGQAAFVLPHLAETTPSEVWVGFRPGSDALHIGTWSSNRLYLAYGHYRNGILLAPATAQRLAEEISANWGTR
jgi:glycine oxidase